MGESFFNSTLNTFLPVLQKCNAFLWGPPITILLLGVGIYLTVRLNFITWRKLPEGFARIWQGRTACKGKGEISPFNALMTALAATIGTGNIVGVATALFAGGPGALFWMWITGILGITTKFAECVLAVQYREKSPDGSYVGGPMYYIKNGLSKKWRPLATFFAISTAFASLGTGNAVQTNAIAKALENSYGISPYITAVLLFLTIGAVILGGLKVIGSVAGKLVPFMALLYTVASLIVIITNIDKIPGIFALVFESAFTTQAQLGGFLGASMQMAMRYGLARGVFVNEAGLGSSPIIHATAITKGPVHQGMIAMVGTVIDTLFLCTLTGLVILITGVWTSGADGAALTSSAFVNGLGSIGIHVVPVCLALFASTTILGWCVYGERSLRYLFGDKSALPFRMLFMVIVPLGAIVNKSDLVWQLADFFNGMMIIPNVIGILLLSPVIVRLVKEYKTECYLDIRVTSKK